MVARGACMVAGGACVVARGVWGCVVAGGCAWLRGGMRGCRGGMHGCQGVCRIRRDTVNKRAVGILLECILVISDFCNMYFCGCNK